MAPPYKLSYFDVTGPAEPIRFLLTHGGIEFEDNRIQREDWPAIKPTMPFGHMPVLEHNGPPKRGYCQILGKTNGSGPKRRLGNLEIDAAVDTFIDLILKMAPAYKLTYFDFTGVGEAIRFLLSYGGIEFEDNRIARENWPAIKPTMPFGRMPVLEYDGKIAHQSLAIARYLAKQVDLVGKDDWENLEIDAAVETFIELVLKIAHYHYETDEELKEAKRVTLYNETIPFYVEKTDARAKKNNGYLAVDRLSWADIFFVAMLDYINFMAKKDIIADSPNLQIVRDNVLKLPNIQAWIEKRPKGTV